jgi:hypothetical protein
MGKLIDELEARGMHLHQTDRFFIGYKNEPDGLSGSRIRRAQQKNVMRRSTSWKTEKGIRFRAAPAG